MGSSMTFEEEREMARRSRIRDMVVEAESLVRKIKMTPADKQGAYVSADVITAIVENLERLTQFVRDFEMGARDPEHPLSTGQDPHEEYPDELGEDDEEE